VGPFTDPVAQVLIVNPHTTEEWAFDLGVGRAAQYPFITGVTLSMAQGLKAAVSVEVSAPYREAVDLLLSPQTPFRQGHHLFARIGYASQATLWTPWFVGMLTQGGVGLSLDAMGISGSVTAQCGVTESGYFPIGPRIVADPLIGSMGVLRLVASLLGVDLQVSPKASSALGIDEMVGNLHAQVVTKDAYEALTVVCQRKKLQWIVSPSAAKRMVLHIYTEREVEDATVRADNADVVTFQMRGWLDEAAGIYPCLSWSPEGADWATWLAADAPHAGAGVRRTWMDTETGAVRFVEARPAAGLTPVAGATADPDPAVAENEIAGLLGLPDKGAPSRAGVAAPEGPAATAEQQAIADAAQEAGNQAQVGSLTALGLPWFLPPRMCRLAGCGAYYDGRYRVNTVEHTYSAGSYEMTVGLLRLGTGAVPPAGPVQTPPVQQPAT
jgi:hypothetical protein